VSTGLDDPRSITVRLGEQEMVYGTGRLVDNNEGVNVKSSFYGARVIAKTETLRLEVFGVKPTNENTGTIDDGPSLQQTFWGAYGTVPLPLVDIRLEKSISTISELIRRAPTMSRAVTVKFAVAWTLDCSITNLGRPLVLAWTTTLVLAWTTTGSLYTKWGRSGLTPSAHGPLPPKRASPFRPAFCPG